MRFNSRHPLARHDRKYRTGVGDILIRRGKMRFRISTILLATFSGVAAVLLWVEFTSFNRLQSSAAPDRALAVGEPWARALSSKAIQQTLLACDRSMSSPLSNFQTAADLQGTAATCADFASRVTGWQPTHGFAYLVAAQAAHIRGARAQRDELLEKSRGFAPFEGWLVQRRVSLIINQRSADKSALDYQLDADLSTLLTTQSGAELLAAYYLHRPDIRQLLASVTETATLRHQVRFMNQLRLRQLVN